MVFEKTVESPLDFKIKPVNPKGNQSWIFIGRTNGEAETLILRPADEKNWLIWKDPDAGKDWRLEEKGTTEDEMAGWHHQLNAHEFEWTLGVGDGQGGLACCDSWDCKELDMTEWLNWTELNVQYSYMSQLFPLECNFSHFKKYYWDIVALQYCVSFCYAAKWINLMYTYITSVLDFLPIWSPQSIE